jgi:glycosyltransferase involved in cell wall biosynthesis
VLYVSGHWELGFGVLSGMVTRAPFVCHLHMGLDPVEMRADSKIPRLAARARRLIACSSFVRDQFIEGGTDPEKIVTIHGGIALEDYPAASEGQRTAARQRLGLPEDAFVVLFLGRLDAAKGIEVLLEAWRELALPPRDARLLVVGSALFTDPEARARELQELAPPGCHFLPAQRDVVTPLQAADVQVAPSLWEEPFGRVVVEGLAAGLPVVSSRSGGIVEIFDGHDELGQQLLCAPGSVEELCEKIQFLKGWRTHDPALAQRCARVAARFDIETMVDRVEEVLNDAVA